MKGQLSKTLGRPNIGERLDEKVSREESNEVSSSN